MQLHEKIKSLRRSKGWSQEQVAERLSMSASAYGSIERGETDVSFSKLKQLSEIFEIDLSSLLGKGVISFSFTEINNIDFHNWHINSPSNQSEELSHQLKEKDLVIAQKETEIEYLKQQIADLREMIALLKKSD